MVCPPNPAIAKYGLNSYIGQELTRETAAMKTFAAKDAKNGFGRLLDTALAEPVTIEKHGRAVAVVLSVEEYRRLEALEDIHWSGMADEAVARGDWLGIEESERLVKDILDAETGLDAET